MNRFIIGSRGGDCGAGGCWIQREVFAASVGVHPWLDVLSQDDGGLISLRQLLADAARFGRVNNRVLDLATNVIRKSSRERQADSVLRAELKAARGVTADISRDTARTLFAYFRWRGWLDAASPVADQLTEALALQRRFAEEPASFSDEELLSRAIPAWVAEAVAVTPQWVRDLQTQPRLWLRARVGERHSLTMALGDCGIPSDRELGEVVEYQGEQDLFSTPSFHAGDFELQDISSQIVGLVCAPKPGETWWDACAGEGGKMLHLSDLMQNKGLIWASDRADWRLKKLKLRAARSRAFNYRAVLWDGGDRPPTKTKFDGVLVDAPCSGIGTWQRNPHARWTTTAGDVAELSQVQAHLLRTAAGSVKPGGRIVYSVCTLTRAETSEIASGFSREFPAFTPEPLGNPLDRSAAPTPELWLWPAHGGSGMFIASWRRAK